MASTLKCCKIQLFHILELANTRLHAQDARIWVLRSYHYLLKFKVHLKERVVAKPWVIQNTTWLKRAVTWTEKQGDPTKSGSCASQDCKKKHRADNTGSTCLHVCSKDAWWRLRKNSPESQPWHRDTAIRGAITQKHRWATFILNLPRVKTKSLHLLLRK